LNLIVRTAKAADFPAIRYLAEKLYLDSADMRAEEFMVAEDERKIVGIGRIIKHPDCRELATFGIEETHRKKGVGKKLVDELAKKADGPVYLATIIPGYFEKLGFRKAEKIPASMVKKSDWCEGCSRQNCTVMIKK